MNCSFPSLQKYYVAPLLDSALLTGNALDRQENEPTKGEFANGVNLRIVAQMN